MSELVVSRIGPVVWPADIYKLKGAFHVRTRSQATDTESATGPTSDPDAKPAVPAAVINRPHDEGAA